jgi:hypothetical protein
VTLLLRINCLLLPFLRPCFFTVGAGCVTQGSGLHTVVIRITLVAEHEFSRNHCKARYVLGGKIRLKDVKFFRQMKYSRVFVRSYY